MAFLDKIKAAKTAGVPIIGIETVDPAATISMIRVAFSKMALVQWDIVRGLTPVNETGEAIVKNICGDDSPALATGNPTEMLSKIVDVPGKTIIFMHQANALLESQDAGVALPVSQGIWNLRDVFKAKGAILILMGSSFRLPEVLKNDVMVIDEPLPAIEEIKKIVLDISESAGISPSSDDVLKYSKTLLGLSAFSAEQSYATSIYKDGDGLKVDELGLWNRKCKTVEQTKGLSIYRGKETYKDVIGYGNAKTFNQRIMAGPDPVEVYVFIDEIEKQLSGFGSDLSGVTGELMAKMLTWMQMTSALGLLMIGPGGTGKSLVGLATGNEAKKPTVIFDLSLMKGSLVGQSINQLDAAQKMVNGMAGGGKVMIVATCNRFGSLPPELKRRFTLGTFFFDLPTGDERAGLWKYYQKSFGLKNKQLAQIDDDGYTGAEIKNACNIAWRLNCNLSEAASYIVPVCKSSADDIEKLRTMAEGKFISASESGFYKRAKTLTSTVAGGRKGSWSAEEN